MVLLGSLTLISSGWFLAPQQVPGISLVLSGHVDRGDRRVGV